MSNLFQKLLDLFFPLKCVFCGTSLHPGTMPAICTDCNASVQRLGAKCPKCNAVPVIDEDGRPRCHTCKAAGRSFDVAFSVYRYNGNVRNAIVRYKFHSGVEIARTLAHEPGLLVAKLGFTAENTDFIVYIPPDKKRLRTRGYDHMRLIAEGISAATGIPIRCNTLEKRKETKAQSLLSRRGRVLNVKGVYGVPKGVDLKGKSVILLDDVITTGSTVNEAAKALKRAHAEYVAVCTVAYATR